MNRTTRMNDHTSSFAHAGQAPVSHVSSILSCLGWQEQEPAQWRRHTAMGTVQMCRLQASSAWVTLRHFGWLLHGSLGRAIPAPQRTPARTGQVRAEPPRWRAVPRRCATAGLGHRRWPTIELVGRLGTSELPSGARHHATGGRLRVVCWKCFRSGTSRRSTDTTGAVRVA